MTSSRGSAYFVIVADSGLISVKNIALLETVGYKYIIGARIRSESSSTKDWILSIGRTDGHIEECRKNSTQRLIVSYSETRARKNVWNRDKGLEGCVRPMQKARSRRRT